MGRTIQPHHHGQKLKLAKQLEAQGHGARCQLQLKWGWDG